MSKRTCSSCGEEKPLTEEFFRHHAGGPRADGSRSPNCFRGVCTECYNKARREIRAAKKPLTPIPYEGQELKKTATKVDADGTPIEQWIGTRTESLGVEPIRPAIPTGHIIKRQSTLVDSDGSVRAQWTITGEDIENRYAMMVEACKSIVDTWEGKRANVVPAPSPMMEDLMTLYPMGDPHVGMMAWAAETGASFDLKIVERNLRCAIDKLVSRTLPTKKAVLVNIGDFFHSDSRKNQTTAGTPVDVDGRLPKIMGVGVRTMRYLIDAILAKHGDGVVFNMAGNHDGDTSQMLAICLAQFYEHEPRVEVVLSPAKFQQYTFGKTLLAFTHQDTCKIADLPEIMACDWPREWADTQHRYWWTGHIHHKTVTEMRGCVAESLRTLAGSDAWHRSKGYRSGRDMQAITYHALHGEMLRHRVDITEIEMELGSL